MITNLACVRAGCGRRFGRDYAPAPGVWHNVWVHFLGLATPSHARWPGHERADALVPTRRVRCLHPSVLGETTPVAVKIKLKRMGKIHAPFYRIIVADARTKRDGRAIEEIGKYHPMSRALVHRGRLRAGPALAVRRRAADRPGPQDPRDHRRLAEVQGPARRRGDAEDRRAQGRTRRKRSPPRSPRRWVPATAPRARAAGAGRRRQGRPRATPRRQAGRPRRQAGQRQGGRPGRPGQGRHRQGGHGQG